MTRSNGAIQKGRLESPTKKNSIRLGVFSDNHKLPLHRWYPFVEGFSANLVIDAMKERPEGVIFDPFGGSGTTPLTASVNNRKSFFTEVNPFMAWVADVKINKVRELSMKSQSPKPLSKIKFSKNPPLNVLEANPFWEVNKRRDFMSEENAKALISFMHEASKLDGPLAAIARLAGATSILSSSNMVRRTDLRRRTAGDKAPFIFAEVVVERIRIFEEDLSNISEMPIRKAINLGNDARGGWKSPVPLDLIVTSPPYLNGTNYCRNTKMELLACGFIDNEKELQGLRDRSIMAGINNVSSRKSYEVTELPKIRKTVHAVAKKSYDSRIPEMINGYFMDMGMVFESVYEQASSGALLLLDIGDSRFAGVPVDTPKLLVEVAEFSGWNFTKSAQLRTRRSFDGTLLTQDLLEFTK